VINFPLLLLHHPKKKQSLNITERVKTKGNFDDNFSIKKSMNIQLKTANITQVAKKLSEVMLSLWKRDRKIELKSK
jgi:hypothetical protein